MFYYEELEDGSYSVSDGSVALYDPRSDEEFEEYVLQTPTRTSNTKTKTVEEIKKEIEETIFYY